MTDVSEIKTLLEAQAARDDRRHDDNVIWRTKLEGTVRTLADEMVEVRKRQDHFDRRQDNFESELAAAAGRSTEALDATSHLEGRLIGAVNGMASRVADRLESQDEQIAHIKTETDKQTPILAALQTHMAGTQAVGSFLKWAVPLTGGIITVVVPAIYWLITHLSH